MNILVEVTRNIFRVLLDKVLTQSFLIAVSSYFSLSTCSCLGKMPFRFVKELNVFLKDDSRA